MTAPLSFLKFLLVLTFIATQSSLFASEPDDSPQAAASCALHFKTKHH